MSKHLEQELSGNRARIRRVVARRMDRRVRARFDASDVLQEAFLEAHQRQAEPRARQGFCMLDWMRLLAEQKLLQFHRRHLQVGMRDARREEPPSAPPPVQGSREWARELPAGSEGSPSRVAMAAEGAAQVRAALARLEEPDREILALRHVEQLANHQVAALLCISPQAASMRYVRALARLRAAYGPNVP